MALSITREAMVNITTNNHLRDVVNAWELTEAERTQFDYLKWSDIDNGTDSASFVRYRGRLIYLGEFMRNPPASFKGWDGYLSDSFSSGLVIRIADEDSVVIGSFYA